MATEARAPPASALTLTTLETAVAQVTPVVVSPAAAVAAVLADCLDLQQALRPAVMLGSWQLQQLAHQVPRCSPGALLPAHLKLMPAEEHLPPAACWALLHACWAPALHQPEGSPAWRLHPQAALQVPQLRVCHVALPTCFWPQKAQRLLHQELPPVLPLAAPELLVAACSGSVSLQALLGQEQGTKQVPQATPARRTPGWPCWAPP